jgi:hypothetical protein
MSAPQYFREFSFIPQQVNGYYNAAQKNMSIAQQSDVVEVMFVFSYMALIKLGVFVMAQHGYKVRSVPGHHVQLIKKLAEHFNDVRVDSIGNKMRDMRNRELYEGDIEITQKDAEEFRAFVQDLINRAKP